MTETFYDILGVAPDASTEEIESAYRDAIKEVHPDVSDDVDASERTARLNKAKDVLTDDEERARYDRLGHEAYTSGVTGADGADDSTKSSSGGGGAAGPSAASAGSTGSADAGATGGRGGGVSGSRGASDSAGGPSAGGSRRGGGASHRRTGQRRGPNGDGAADFGRQSTSGPWDSPEDSGPSARRQAAADSGGGADPRKSWNAWDTSRMWAVHQDTGSGNGFQVNRLFPPDQSLVLLGSTFLCYPFFVFSSLLPAFPFVVRLTVAVCTLLMIVYLLSIPEAAIVVFGLWSVLAPLGILLIPALSLFSVVGLVAVVATWIPLGFAVLTFVVVRPM